MLVVKLTRCGVPSAGRSMRTAPAEGMSLPETGGVSSADRVVECPLILDRIAAHAR